MRRRPLSARRAVQAFTGRLPKPLHHKAPVDDRDGTETLARRRRVVAVVTVAGGGLLGVSLSSPPGSSRFFALTFAVAGTWLTGGAASGPLHLGWIQGRDDLLRRPVVTPVLTGCGAFGLFYGCALVVRRIPVLAEAVARVLRFADAGDERLVLLTAGANGVAEEIFFRGALFAAVGDRHPVAATTAVYTLATVPTRNPALVLAAAVMGTLFALQRRASGGLQAPVLTHLTWSTLMIRYLPPLFRGEVPGHRRNGDDGGGV